MSIRDYSRCCDFQGVMNSIAAVLPGMLTRKKGHIISISSNAGRKVSVSGNHGYWRQMNERDFFSAFCIYIQLKSTWKDKLYSKILHRNWLLDRSKKYSYWLHTVNFSRWLERFLVKTFGYHLTVGWRLKNELKRLCKQQKFLVIDKIYCI